MQKAALCRFYTTNGHPMFKPICLKRLKGSLKCHKKDNGCKEYKAHNQPVPK